MTPIEVIAKAREIARARTRGPWREDRGDVWGDGPSLVKRTHAYDGHGCATQEEYANARFIVLSDKLFEVLLDVAEKANRLSDNIAEFGEPTDSCFLENMDEALNRLGEVKL